MEDVKKNDWFATLLFNPDIESIEDFKRLDITPSNTGLKPIDDYKNIPEVQEHFVNKDTGKFDESSFRKFYDNAKLLYNDYSDNEFLYNAVSKFEYGKDAWFAPIDSPIRDDSPKFIFTNDPSKYGQGIPYITESAFESTSGFSARELAQNERVVDWQTGEDLGWTPNEKGGLFKSLNRPILVLAQYDNDGVHMENGIEVSHKKGDLKFNENGRPYYETLGNRDIYGRDVLHFTDTLTVDGTTINKFDIFDGDDKKKSITKSLIKTVAAAVPMFISGPVGMIYGAIGASMALGRVLPIVAKGLDGFITGTDDNAFGREMSKWEAWSEANLNFQTTSDYSREHLVSIENLGNMIGAVSGQLFQQKLIGTIPAILNRGGDYLKNAEIGRNLALTYMAATSAQDSYADFKQAGASDFVAGAGMLASMLSLYGLMNQEYFRDRIFKYSFMDETGVKVPAFKVANDVEKNILTKQGLSKPKTAGLVKKLKSLYDDKIRNSLASVEWLDRSFAEGVEEVMEEVSTDAVKAITSVFNSLGINVTEQNKDLDFGFSGKDIASRYGMSAVGGFIGGGIFHAQSKLDSYYRNKYVYQLKNDIADDDLKRITYYIAQGQADNIRGFYTKWWKQGRLGSTDLKIDASTISYLDGNHIVHDVAQKGDFTINDAVYSTLMNLISDLEQTIKSEGNDRWLSEQELKKILARGFDAADKDVIKAHILVEAGSHSRFLNDFYDLLGNIVSKRSQLDLKVDELAEAEKTKSDKEKKADEIEKNKDVKRLKKEIEELEEEKEAFLSGKKNKYYAGQGLFVLNKPLSKIFSGISSVEDFVLRKYAKDFNTLPQYKKDKYTEEYNEYVRFKGTELTLKAYDVYLESCKNWKQFLQKSNEVLRGVKPDETHSDNIEAANYAQLAKEYYTIEKDIKDLQAKEIVSGSQEEKTLEEKLNRAHEIQSILGSINKNPGFVLYAMLNDKKYGELNDYYLKDGLSDEDMTKLDEMLTTFYSETASKHGYLSNDDRLNGMYALARKQFLRGNTKARIYDWTLKEIQKAVPEYIPQESDDFILEQKQDWLINQQKGTDDLFGDHDFVEQETPFQKELRLMIDDAVDSLGFDNASFVKKVENIKKVLKSRTNLSDEQINDFISQLLPRIGKENVLDNLAKYDEYKKNIVYSQFIELFKNIKFNIGDENNIIESSLFDLVTRESKNLATSDKLEDFVLSEKVKNIFNLKNYRALYEAIFGVITGSWDNTNHLINNYQGGEMDELPEIDENVGTILLNEATLFINRIEQLKRISDANQDASLRKQMDVELNMRPKFIKELINPAFAAKFDETFKPKSETPTADDDDEPTLIKIWQDLIPDNFDWDTLSNDEYVSTMNAVFIKMEQAVGDIIREYAKTHTVEEVGNALYSLVADEKSDLYKMVSSSLSVDKEEIVENYDFLTYLATIAAVPAETYTAHQSNCLSEKDADGNNTFKIAPVYGQDFAVRFFTAYCTNAKLFNYLLDKITNDESIKLDEFKDSREREVTEKWLKAHSRLYNFLMVPGGAGTGKSVGVVQYFLNSVKSYAGLEVKMLAPSKKQVNDLAKGTGWNVERFDKNTFFEKIAGGQIGDYYLEDGMVKTRSNIEFKDDLFDKNKDLKILVVDEITLFTGPELNVLSQWAVRNGVLILAIGDRKQNSAKVVAADDKGNSSSVFAGIEDCFYLRTPELTESLRTLNAAKIRNYQLLNRLSKDIDKDYSRNPHYRLSDLNSKCPDKISLLFYESDDKSVLLGEKITKSTEDFEDTIERFKDKGSIAIITDNVEKYNKKYIDAKNISVIHTGVAQGGEYDYVFIDKDFKKEHGNNKYPLLKDIYTLTQRSRIATVILNNGLTDIITIEDNVSNPEYNQEYKAPSEEQIESFRNWKLASFAGINAEDNLFDLFVKGIEYRKPISIFSKSVKKAEESVSNDTEEVEKKKSGNIDDAVKELEAEEPSEESTSGTAKTSEEKPQISEKKSNLPPAPKKAVNKTGSETIKLSAKYRIDYLSMPSLDFIKAERGQEHSLYNFFSDDIKRNIEKDILKYKKDLNTIASYALLNESLSEIDARNVSRHLIGDDSLLEILTQVPEIWLDKGRITARYTYNGDYFEVLIGTIKNSKRGKLNGSFSLIKPLSIKGDRRITLPEFEEEFPFLTYNNTFGVLTTTVERAKELGLNEETLDFIFAKRGKRSNANVGKLFTGITSNTALARERFGNTMYGFPGTGWSISKYGGYALAALQKISNPIDIFNYVRSIVSIASKSNKNKTDIILYDGSPLKEDMSPEAVVKAISNQDIVENELEYRRYQVIPATQLGLLLGAMAESDTTGEIMHNLYLHTTAIKKPNSNRTSRGEKHGLIVTNSKGSFYITVKTNNRNEAIGNKFVIYHWDDATDSIKVDDNGNDLIFKEVTWVDNKSSYETLKSFFDSNESLRIVPAVYVLPDETGKPSIWKITPNKAIYIAINKINNDKLKSLAGDLKQHPEFKHNIFFNVYADEKDFSFGNESLYKKYNDTIDKNMISIAIGDMDYEMYEFVGDVVDAENESNNPIETEELSVDGKPAYKTLDDCLIKENINVFDVSVNQLISSAKTDEEKVNIYNDWLLAMSDDYKNAKKIVISENGLFYVQDNRNDENVEELSLRWLKLNFATNVLKQFNPNVNINPIGNEFNTPDSDLKTRKYWHFSLTLSNESEPQIWVIRDNNGSLEYIQTKTFNEFNNVVSNLYYIEPSIKAYVDSLIFEYDDDGSKIDDYLKTIAKFNDVAEVQMFRELVNKYLEAKLKNNEC